MLAAQQQRCEERLQWLESKLKDADAPCQKQKIEDVECPPKAPSLERRKKLPPRTLLSLWYEWFTAAPRLYEQQEISKMRGHEASHAVAHMMLFLPNGFSTDPAAPTFKSEVDAYGVQAQSNVLSFVKQNGSQAAAAGPVVKVLRGHMRVGALDSYLHRYRCLREQGRISDSTPSSRLPRFMHV